MDDEGEDARVVVLRPFGGRRWAVRWSRELADQVRRQLATARLWVEQSRRLAERTRAELARFRSATEGGPSLP